MIRFIDIENGKTYDGSISYLDSGAVDMEASYVHWFDGPQSTDLIYSKNICVLSDSKYLIAYLTNSEYNEESNNNIFHLIDPQTINSSTEETVNGFTYNDINQMHSEIVVSTGVQYDDEDLYVHMFYFDASSIDSGEFREVFELWSHSSGTSETPEITPRSAPTVNDYSDLLEYANFTKEGEFIIGADFYCERPELRLNLENFGINIPKQVQKAIYPADVLEENIDNILLNRKYKELLMDHINILGNRGSYNSLLRSLDWFEYPQGLLELKEFWKHNEWGRTIYNDEEFHQIMTKSLKIQLENYSKTTYIGIFCALQQFKKHNNGLIKYNITEGTPELENRVFDWSVEEMSIKLALLGNFYEVNFMPIHLDLICSTLEDVVYTNSIKVIHGGEIDRVDYIIQEEPVKCNIKNNQVFALKNVSVGATPATPFVNEYKPGDAYNTHNIVGVEEDVDNLRLSVPDSGNITDEDLKTFLLNYYSGVGVVIPCEFKFKTNPKDSIIKESLAVLNINTNKWENNEFNYIFTPDTNGYVTAKMSILCTQDRDYDLRVSFRSTSGETYVKRIIFKVVDTNRVSLNLYKIRHKSFLSSLLLTDQTTSPEGNDFMFSHYYNKGLNSDNSINLYTQYIPSSINMVDYDNPYDIFNCNGILLHHVLILSGDAYRALKAYDNNANTNTIFTILEKNYDLYKAFTNVNGGDNDNNIRHVTYVKKRPTICKSDMKDIDDIIFYINSVLRRNSPAIYDGVLRSGLEYFPQLHVKEYIDRTVYENLIVQPWETLCVVPNIKFLKYISDSEWIFTNTTTGQVIKLPSIKEPFVANDDLSKYRGTPPGYYDIEFRYKLSTNGDEVHSVKLKGAFIQQGLGEDKLDLSLK